MGEVNAEQWIEQYLDDCLDRTRGTFRIALARLSSPIEKVMMAYIMAQGFEYPGQERGWGAYEAIKKLSIVKQQYIAAADPCLYGWYVIAQPTIQFDGFVVTPDFALLDPDMPNGQPPMAIAIELDGHDFHERTKEQATRDKKRDRALVSAGWSVLRFTGSEVIKAPSDVFDAWEEAAATEYKKRGKVWG